MATFALDGPLQCSGLDVVRYGPEELQVEIGPAFELVETYHLTHTTPWASQQQFIYSWFRRL